MGREESDCAINMSQLANPVNRRRRRGAAANACGRPI
jgi:hypothetical protein